MSGSIGQRKSDHITLCATGEVGFRTMGPLFDQVRLVHDALPDLDADALDTSVTLFGKKLRAPLVIASMTGGTEDAGRINRELASLAEERGIAFGLGSQRAMHVRKGTASTYRVRDVAPSTVVLGNVGVVQAREMSTADVRALVDEVGADALCVHLNPAMELVQPGGDRDFTRGLETIARLVRELGPDGGARPIPVVVKETGCGIGPHVAARLRERRRRCTSTSRAREARRGSASRQSAPPSKGTRRARALGEAFWDWGIPTAACVALARAARLQTVIATGGVATGLDVAKAIALGATAAGIARPVLKALVAAAGAKRRRELLDAALAELRAAMLLTGSANLASLRRAPRVLGGDLSLWVDQLSKRER